jgi:hypothetical protein
MLFGACRIVVLGLYVSPDEQLHGEVDNMRKAPKKLSKRINKTKTECCTRCIIALHQIACPSS